MSPLPALVPGLAELQARTLGEGGVRVAVLDGPVDVAHACFHGSRLSTVNTLVHDSAGPGKMSRHGTHVTSVLFGQPGSPVQGIAPGCQGLLLPVFQDYKEGQLPQLDLARAIEQAVIAGAHVINISGGELSADAQADPLLQRSLQRCEENNVLVVAAAGNNGDAVVHVPAAIPSVLAVGALGRNGQPLPSSNWGSEYRRNGLLALGEKIAGAVPGGGTAEATGTSFATPIVTGVAALLLSLQLQLHGELDPGGIRQVLLGSATACEPATMPDCERYLAGVLNIPQASALVVMGGIKVAESDTAQPPPPGTAPVEESADGLLRASGAPPYVAAAPPAQMYASSGAGAGASSAPDNPTGHDGTAANGPMTFVVPPGMAMAGMVPSQPFYYPGYPATALPPWGPGSAPMAQAGIAAPPSAALHAGAINPSAAPAGLVPASTVAPAVVGPSDSCGCGPSAGGCDCKVVGRDYVYALGTIGTDFGTEARRDTFRQLMPDVIRPGEGEDGVDVFVAANPYDVFQLADYLDDNPHESTKLIWTLNLDLTPIYAVEAEPDYAEAVYSVFRQALRNEALPADDDNFVARVSIPGVLTGRTVQLYSGQVVPVVRAQRRGMYTWNETQLLNGVVGALRADDAEFDEDYLRRMVRTFLDKVYFQCRNLGQAPADRALNFAVTNAYQFASGIVNGVLTGRLNVAGAENEIYTLDTINVSRSPYCRVDSDCWDVQIKWFNPENDRRAKSVYQFTIDVADALPVTLAPAHQYLTT